MKHWVIKPRTGWSAFHFRELWDFRDLFFILTLRNLKLRYKQTLLGIAWVVLQPLITTLLFALIFGRLAHLPSDGVPYMLFAFAGMMPWFLFSQSIQRACNSLISDARLISKVYFPRILIPLSNCAAVIVDFLVCLVVMLIVMGMYQLPLTWNLLLFPLLLLMTLILSIGVSLWVSALNVYYRDFSYALPFLIQVWMYASPLVYSSSIIPVSWMPFYLLNPIVGIIDGFRWAFLGLPQFPWFSVSISLAITLFITGFGILIFKRIERHFADVI